MSPGTKPEIVLVRHAGAVDLQYAGRARKRDRAAGAPPTASTMVPPEMVVAAAMPPDSTTCEPAKIVTPLTKP